MAVRGKKIKVIHKNLNREKVFGRAYIPEKVIEIHYKLKPLKELEIMIHEALHIFHPTWSETKVKITALKTAKFLWQNSYRKVKQ